MEMSTNGRKQSEKWFSLFLFSRLQFARMFDTEYKGWVQCEKMVSFFSRKKILKIYISFLFDLP